MNSAGRQIQSMDVEVFPGMIVQNDLYVLQISNWKKTRLTLTHHNCTV